MDNTYQIVVIVSANVEWQAVKDYYQPETCEKKSLRGIFSYNN